MVLPNAKQLFQLFGAAVFYLYLCIPYEKRI